MNVYRSFSEIPYQEKTVLTIGTFDGVHRGHRLILDALTRQATALGGRSVVLTFHPHPQEVLRKTGSGVPILTTIDERIALLDGLGVDALIIAEFTTEFAATPWQQFCDMLIQEIGVAHMIVGHDHAFGKNREGNADSLRKLGLERGFAVTEIGPLVENDEAISSTKIRNALASGDVATAADFMGRAYSLGGIVVRGDGRGRTIGVPTANIKPESSEKLIPGNGVYCVTVQIDKALYRGMANIGVRPTFTEGTERSIEAHLFNFDDELYDRFITIEFRKFVRSERKFGSLDEFLQQLEKDRAACINS